MTDTLTGHEVEGGTLPAGWAVNDLAEAAEVVMGQSPPGSTYNENGAGMPFFQGKAEFGALHPIVRKWTTAGKRFAQAGDILMSVRAPVGPTNLADVDCVIGRGLAAIRAREHVDQTFLLWTLRHFEDEISARGTGTTFDSISGDALRSQNINIPPLPEQERIVEILEEQLSRLDTALESVHSVREKAAQFRRSLLHAAFTGGLTGHDVEEGDLPHGWDLVTLGDVCTKPQYGWTTSAAKEGSIKLLRTTDLTHGPIDWATVPFCEETPSDLGKYLVESDDILISRAGSVGVSVLVTSIEEESVFASYLIRVTCLAVIRSKYLKYFLESPAYWSQISDMSAGTALANVNATKLRALELPLPALEEQEWIVEILEDQLSRLDAALTVADAVEGRSAALRRSLLYSAFTGRLTEEWREAVNV